MNNKEYKEEGGTHMRGVREKCCARFPLGAILVRHVPKGRAIAFHERVITNNLIMIGVICKVRNHCLKWYAWCPVFA